MAIMGLGTDLIETARIERSVTEQGDRFLQRCFTESELAYAARSSKRRMEHLAARFAAKEAAMKALGTGWSEGVAWTDFEVVRDAAGKPSLHVTGQAAQLAESRGIAHWHLTMSHTEAHATATVIAESGCVS